MADQRKPDAVVVYDDIHVTYLRDWELDTRDRILQIEGRILNSGHLPIVGHAVPVRELHIPGRGALSGILATIDIYNLDDQIRLRVMTQEIPHPRKTATTT